MQKFFIFGMFRSGTTFLSKILNNEKKIICASDCIFPVFKMIRNQIINNRNKVEPFNHYIFDKKQMLNFEKIQRANLSKILVKTKYEEINFLVNDYAKNFHPALLDRLKLKKNFFNFKEIIDYYFFKLKKIKPKVNVVGFKEVWLNEFIPILNKYDKKMKFILLIRDPRSIVSSNFANKNNSYPIFFLICQWLKIANLTIYYKKKYHQNILVIRYEDLILDKKKILSQLENFLNLKKNTLKNIKKISEDNWKQNSAYKLRSKLYNKSSLHKWKKFLTKSEIKYIEKYCFLEMKYFKYPTIYNINSKSNKDFKIPIKRFNYSKWINEYKNLFKKNKKVQENYILKRINLLKEKKYRINYKKFFINRNLYFLHKRILSKII